MKVIFALFYMSKKENGCFPDSSSSVSGRDFSVNIISTLVNKRSPVDVDSFFNIFQMTLNNMFFI